MSRDLNLKILSYYKKSTMKKLIKIFGSDSVFLFPNSKVVGLSYNHQDRKLRSVFEKIPFKETQQLYITPPHFIKIIFNLVTLGIRPNLEISTELPDDVKQDFDRIIHYLYRQKDLYALEQLEQKLDEIEEEYGASLVSISYVNNQKRNSLRANGILFTDPTSIDLIDQILTLRGL